MSALVLNDDKEPAQPPNHSVAVTLLASDVMWGVKVYRGRKTVGSIARLFLNQQTGAVERIEISQRLGKPALFVRWSDLRFDVDPLRVQLVDDLVELPSGSKPSLLERLYRAPGFWGMG